MKLKSFRALTWLTALGLLLAGMTSTAMAADKSMADTKIVLQISDPNPFKQTMVLNVANNIIKHYGQDLVKVEIVAFGPGLRLLFEENANKERIQGLTGQGVRFSACANTVDGMSKILGHKPVLNSQSVVVDAGVVRIVDLVKQGYILVKP
ncbi:MAG: hypothetical protein R6X06_09675 [Gammaproteobacteria bacterium]